MINEKKQPHIVFIERLIPVIIIVTVIAIAGIIGHSYYLQKSETLDSEVTCTVNEDLTQIEFAVPHIPDPENIPCSAYYSNGITETWEFKGIDNEVVHKIIYDGSHYSLFIDKNQVTE